MTNPPNPRPEESQGFEAYPQYTSPEEPETPEWARSTPPVGTGKVNVMEAIPWAFKAVFASWYIWILGALVIGIVVGLASYFAAPDYSAAPDAEALNSQLSTNLASNGVVGLAQLLLSPFLLVGLLAQVTKRRISLADFFRNVPYLKVLGVSVLQSILFIVVMVPLIIALATTLIATGSMLLMVLGALGLLLVLWLISPLFSLWTWYAADGHGVGESIKLGFAAGKRNYPQLLLLSFLGTIALMVGGLLTFGLGFLVLVPAYYLATAHVYRQASAGQLPA